MNNKLVSISRKFAYRRLILAAAVSLGAISTFAYTDGDWTFTYSGSTATITGYSGSDTIVTVPSTVTRTETYQERDNEGNYHTRYRYYHYTVTAIRYSLFKNNTSLTSITIPSSITSIGSELFYGCTSLQFVAIHANISAIPYRTFYGCSSLVSVSLPDTITEIGEYAFYGCTNLEMLTLPASISSIGRYAFYGCANVTTPSIPYSVTSIGESAFTGCGNAFAGELVLNPKITSLGMAAFYGCTSITSVVVSCTISSLPNALFCGCSSLETVVIGDGVKNLGSGQNSEWYYPFMNCPKIKSFTVGRGITSIPAYYFGWHDRGGFTKTIESIVLPDTITSIGDYAFSACTNLTAFSLPVCLTTIGNCAFFQCDRMLGETITLGPQVKTIGYRAFQLCSSLSEICFEGVPPSVGFNAFSDMAPGARGYYPRSLASEWLPKIDSNGKWNGLIMHELSQPVLRVKSANPAEGSITLAWDDDTEGQCVSSYSIYRSANDTFTETDRVATGITDTEWTDTGYWSAEPVLSPLNYWVVAESDYFDLPESNAVETRHRYGVFVGVGEYEKGLINQLTGFDLLDWRPNPKSIEHAELFGRLACENGFSYTNVLTGETAKKDTFRQAMQTVAGKVQTGDYVAVFCSSHGDNSKLASFGGVTKFSGIAMYDKVYEKDELAEDLLALVAGKKGISVAIILNTCYSGGAVSAAPAGENIAWIVSCKESETTSYFPEIGSLLPNYLLEYGWNRGGAANSVGAFVTFADLWDYVNPCLTKFRRMKAVDETHGVAGRNVLEHFIAGRVGTAQYETAPEMPAGIEVESMDGAKTITWSRDTNAEYYVWVWEDEGNGKRICGAITDNMGLVKETGISFLPMHSFLFKVAAINEHGISAWSEERVAFPNKFWQWMTEKYLDFQIDESTPMDIVATAAASASSNGATFETCYIAGLNPNDSAAKFQTTISMDADGKPIVSWTPDLNEGGTKSERVYRVLGAKSLGASAEWDDITDIADPDAEGYRFFKVSVEMP